MVRMVCRPAVARIAKNSGLDFIMLDMEHGPFTLETVDGMFQLARAVGLGGFVRVPELSRGYVSRIMDSDPEAARVRSENVERSPMVSVMGFIRYHEWKASAGS